MTQMDDSAKRSKRESNRRWREKNRDHIREYNRRYSREQPPRKPSPAIEAKRALVREAKDRPCTDCGKKLAPHRMHFDHVRGQKMFELKEASHRALALIEAEIAKCEVRCDICHGRRHRAEQCAAADNAR